MIKNLASNAKQTVGVPTKPNMNKHQTGKGAPKLTSGPQSTPALPGTGRQSTPALPGTGRQSTPVAPSRGRTQPNRGRTQPNKSKDYYNMAKKPIGGIQ